MTSGSVFGFWHIATMGNWRDVIQDQLLKLTASGLLERADRIFVGICGPEIDEIRFAHPKLELVFKDHSLNRAEAPTLEKLHDFSRGRDGAVFYIHTKGVSREPHEQSRMTDWHRLMEYFNITRFQDCIEHLCYYDVCGVNWHDWPYPHFSGNFWWANSEYVAGLPPLSDLCRPEDCGPDSRHWCERWLGSSPSVRAHSFHESGINHYLESYPRSKYSPIREVTPTASWLQPSAWRGLENRLQDLLQPVGAIDRIVELGVEYGYSLFCLASAVPEAEVIGVDPYDTLPPEERQLLAPLGSQAVIGSCDARAWTLDQLHHFANARLMIMTGEKAFAEVPGAIDVLHIDAVHTRDAVEADFNRWEPKIRSGGCVLFHDTVAYANDVGRFFQGLPGHKVEIPECNGLGAWYKP